MYKTVILCHFTYFRLMVIFSHSRLFDDDAFFSLDILAWWYCYTPVLLPLFVKLSEVNIHDWLRFDIIIKSVVPMLVFFFFFKSIRCIRLWCVCVQRNMYAYEAHTILRSYAVDLECFDTPKYTYNRHILLDSCFSTFQFLRVI